MPPPGYEPFLRAICADPEDDTVRLVYADWLDENGDPDRAEFIRLQVAMPERPKEFDPRFARMEELRKAHGPTWRAELPKISGISYGQFRRGFIDGVTFQHFLKFAEHASVVLALTPACDVRLTQTTARNLSTLLSSSLARRLTMLRMNAGIEGAEVIEALASVSWEWKFTELDITAWGPNQPDPFRAVPMITDSAALAVLESSSFPNLRILRLNGVNISEAVYAALVDRFETGLWVYPRMSSTTSR